MPTGDKISALPAATALTGAELTAVVQGGVTKQATVQAVADFAAWGQFYPAVPPTATHTGDMVQTTVATVTIPGDTIKTGAMIEVLYGTYSNSAAMDDSLAIVFDGTTIATIIIPFDGAAVYYPVVMDYVFAKSLAVWVGRQSGQVAVDFTANVDVTFKITCGDTANTAGLWTYGVRVTGGS